MATERRSQVATREAAFERLLERLEELQRVRKVRNQSAKGWKRRDEEASPNGCDELEQLSNRYDLPNARILPAELVCQPGAQTARLRKPEPLLAPLAITSKWPSACLTLIDRASSRVLL